MNYYFSGLLSLFLFLISVSAQITPPYTISFEATDGFTDASLHDQEGWHVTAGSASVISSEAFHGSKSVVISAGFSAASISQSFSSFSGGEIVFVDFYARLVAGSSISTASVFNAESSFAGLVKVGSQGEVYVSNGDGAGDGTWEATGFLVPLTTGDLSTNWVRFTMRLNFTDKKWDLFLDGDLVSFDLGFRDNTKTYLSTFNLTGHTATDGYFDYLYVWMDNPLYTDLDQDGMEDSWETAHGLNTALIDRDSDLDGDGLKNIEEYGLGTDPAESDSDGDGLTDDAEIYLGTNPLVVDNYTPEFPVSGVLLHLRADAGLVIDGGGYLSQWTDRSGNGHNATQTTGSAQPQVIASQLNDWPVVRFDGAGDYLSLPDLMSGATEGEIFIVARLQNFDNPYNGLAQFGMANGVAYSQDVGDLLWEDFGRDDYEPIKGPGAAILTQPHVYNASVTAEAVSSVRFNGMPLIERTAEAVVFTTTPLLGNDVFNEYFKGDIAEVLVFDRVLTRVEREAVHTWLQNRYGALFTPPSAPILAGSPVGSSKIDLSWSTDAGQDFIATLERRSGEGEFEAIASLENEVSVTDTGLTGGVTYIYRLKIANASGVSAYSSEVSVWTPSNIALPPTVGMRLWLRATAGVPASGPVDTWRDQSGLGNDAFQTNPDLRPAVVIGSGEEFPAVRFNPSLYNQFLKLPDLMDGATAGEAFVVLRRDVSYSGVSGLWRFGTGSGSRYPEYDGHLRDDFGASAWYEGSAPAPAGIDSLHLYNVGAGDTAWFQNFNGTPLVARPAQPIVFSSEPELSYGAVPFAGDLVEVLIYDRVLTDAERKRVEHYLSKRHLLGWTISDQDVPTKPGRPDALSLDAVTVRLTWVPSVDDTDVAEYRIFESGKLVGRSPVATFEISGLQSGKRYEFFVQAVDLFGKTSPISEGREVYPSAPWTHSSDPSGDIDQDGILNAYDADPTNPTIGALSITIESPAASAVLE